MTTLVRGERPALTGPEQGLRALAAIIGLLSLGFALLYLDLGTFGRVTPEPVREAVDDVVRRRAEFPFAVNSVAKDALLFGLALALWLDVRRWSPLVVPALVAVHLLMPVVLVLTLVAGSHEVDDTLLVAGTQVPVRPGWIAADLVIAGLLVVVAHHAVRARHDLRHLPPIAFRALVALAEVLVLQHDRDIAPAEVGVRIDHHLAGLRARGRWKIRAALVALALWPLLTLRPPFHLMTPERRRRWIERRFHDATRDLLLPAFVRDLRRAAIRTAQQFCFFGYYGDERAAAKVGYVPPSKLLADHDRLLADAARSRRSVTCMRPDEVVGEVLHADVVVVGSGAAGATLALELARRGRDVLVLERGPHVDPGTFGEDEAEQLGRLYAEGALTLTNDFRLQVLQGTCVGGSTVVNNGVCLDPPDDVLERWLDPGQLDAGLDADRLRRAVADARRLLRTRRLGPPDDVLNPGGEALAGALGGSLEGFEVVEANMRPCLGCGHCNLGCRFDRKLSALDWILPEAQAQHRDAVRILPDCRVERILTRGPRATGVEARLGDGRRLEVRAEKVVLSAGAIASSLVLQRSGLGGGRAGRGLAFNLVSPVTLDFDRVLHSERGAQISHVLESRDERGERVLLETWFNPVVTQSLAMPGWFDEHWDNMRRYRHMTCLGVVIGSEGRAEVRRGLLGPDVRYRPTDGEIVRLKQGVRLACEVGLRAGARRAMPATIRSLTVREPRELARIETEIGGLDDLLVSTSHPQGGNPVSRDAQRGVVDPGFRVHGTENAYVCDASVFPSAITVNPQLTVVALAVYAADEIAGPPRPPARPTGASGAAPQAAPSTVQAAPAGGAT